MFFYLLLTLVGLWLDMWKSKPSGVIDSKKGFSAAGQDDLGANRLKQVDELFVGTPIEHQCAAIGVKRPFQHPCFRTGQTGIGCRDQHRSHSWNCSLLVGSELECHESI